MPATDDLPFSQEILKSFGFLFNEGIRDQGGGRIGARHRASSSLTSLGAQAFSFDEEFNRRQDMQEEFLTGEVELANQGFAEQEDRLNRLFRARSAGEAGQAAAQGLKRLASRFGARGIDPNSGNFAGAAANIATAQQGQLTRARGDIALDSARRRREEVTRRLTSSFGLADFRTRERSLVGLDTTAGIANVQLQREANADQRDQAKNARRAGEIGGLLTGFGKLAGAGIGAA